MRRMPMDENSTIEYEEYERRSSAAQEVFSAAYELVPGNDTWGFFAYSDAPGAIGGGFGLITWSERQPSSSSSNKAHRLHEPRAFDWRSGP